MILMTVLFIKVLIWVGPLPTVYYLICLLCIYLNTNLQSLLDLLWGLMQRSAKYQVISLFFLQNIYLSLHLAILFLNIIVRKATLA